MYLYQTENALVLVRDRQAALVGDVCSEWEASQLVRLLRCEGIDRLELLLCTSPTTDDSAGIDLLLEEIDAKAAVIPPGEFYPAHPGRRWAVADSLRARGRRTTVGRCAAAI